MTAEQLIGYQDNSERYNYAYYKHKAAHYGSTLL